MSLDDAVAQKRPRQSLFLSDSDDDERPPKRATSTRPDVDALFDNLDKDEEDEDLRYKPLAPALDLEKLAKEAEVRHARAGRSTGPLQFSTGSAKMGIQGGGTGKDDGKSKADEGEKKSRKVLPKLDEERLVGPDGFPLLIEEIKRFQPKGKGNEHTDLNRLLQVYQFWTHKMYPKTSFKDTVNRVEKLCHSKRMQVRLSVWRDEFKGITNNEDVIDLTEPTLVEVEDDKEPEDHLPVSDRASHTPSLPPVSSEPDDDDFDIEAVIRAEEERLATLRAATADSGSPQTSTLAEKAPSGSGPEVNGMDIDEASLWEAFDEPLPPLSIPGGDDEDMWGIVDEMEQREQSKLTNTQIPVSGVNLAPSLDSTNTGNTLRATNDDDWDEMYS